MAYFEGNQMTGGYGNGPDIINSCTVNVNKGEIVSILGPNGAGKSTAMKAMLGLLNLKSGSVIIDGKDISKLSPQDRVKEGISFVPQTKNVFAGMTVEENLEMGAFLINDEIKDIVKQLQEIDFTYVPCYEDTIDNIQGFLSLNKKAEFLGSETKSIRSLKDELREPLFVPENTPLYKQLANFQSSGRRVGLIVDEYGDIEGIITLRSILEIIVGEITTESIERMDIMPQADGSYLVDGSMMIREVNRRLEWELPTEGPKTLSGLILEEIQTIPDTNVGLSIENYRIETVLIKDNVIKLAKVEFTEEVNEQNEEQE